MIVRSQDKMKIINLSIENKISIYGAYQDSGEDNGFVYTNDDDDAEFWLIESTSVLLGKYLSKEKAIKVLDMIQQEYLRHYYSAGGAVVIPPRVFEMPGYDGYK